MGTRPGNAVTDAPWLRQEPGACYAGNWPTCIAVAQHCEKLGLEVDHLCLVLWLEVVQVGGVDEVQALHVVLGLLQERLGLLAHLRQGQHKSTVLGGRVVHAAGSTSRRGEAAQDDPP